MVIYDSGETRWHWSYSRYVLYIEAVLYIKSVQSYPIFANFIKFSCTVFQNIRKVLKKKCIERPELKSSLIYTSHGKTKILPGHCTNWFTLLFRFSIVLLSYQVIKLQTA